MEIDYVQRLRQEAILRKSIVCMGIDPVIEKIPKLHEDLEQRLVMFYAEILEEIKKQDV